MIDFFQITRLTKSNSKKTPLSRARALAVGARGLGGRAGRSRKSATASGRLSVPTASGRLSVRNRNRSAPSNRKQRPAVGAGGRALAGGV